MDFCRNVTVSGDYHHHHQQDQVLASPPCSKLGSALANTNSPLDDLFSSQNMEVDVSLEWLSVFVEDCFSSTGNCLQPVAAAPTTNNDSVQTTITTPKSPKYKIQENPKYKTKEDPTSLQKFVIPGKARSKRKRVTSFRTRNPLTSWSYNRHQALNFPSTDPPLLQQTHWLADSELIMPKKEDINPNSNKNKGRKDGLDHEQEKITVTVMKESNGQQQPRRCTHCLAQKTPQWRAGPLGPKTLCNACGVRYKSGRLLPEYRPAKSPTFVSYLHSNSHKKVMEMRMATMSTPTPNSS